MEPLEFSIEIEAPREKVWEVLWRDETFRDWTSAFAQDPAGAHLESDWDEGSRFEYFDGDAGSYGVIEGLVPAERVAFRHLGEIDGGEDRPSNEGDTFVEEYRLDQADDLTTLRLSLDTPPAEHRDTPASDPQRVQRAREAVGDDVELYVDANGAHTRKQARHHSQVFAEHGVTWREGPVSSDDLEGLRLLRDRGPAGMDIAAGEYGDHLHYFRDMLAAGAVDCLQADVGRCGGFTAFLDVAALCRARPTDLSSHTAPQISAHVATGVQHADAEPDRTA